MVAPLTGQERCTQLFAFAGPAEEWLLRKGRHLPSARMAAFTVLLLLLLSLVGRQVTAVLGS